MRALRRTGTGRRTRRGTRARSSTMRSMSGCAPAQILWLGKVRLEVHRQRRAQVREAGVHLAADRAAVRAGDAVGGQQAGLRADLVQVLGDRQRVPDLAPSCDEAGHADRRREQQQLLARVGVVGRDHHLVELEAGEARQQPAAQRPGRIVLAAESVSVACAMRRCRAGASRRRLAARGAAWRSGRHRRRVARRWVASACQHRLADELAASCSHQALPARDADHDVRPTCARPTALAAARSARVRGPVLLEARPDGADSRTPARRRLRTARARRADPPAPAVRHRHGSRRRRERAGGRGNRRIARRSRRCCRFRKDGDGRAAARAARRADVGAFRDAAARHRAHAARATTTSTSPTGTTCATCRSPPAGSASTNTPST